MSELTSLMGLLYECSHDDDLSAPAASAIAVEWFSGRLSDPDVYEVVFKVLRREYPNETARVDAVLDAIARKVLKTARY